MYLLLTPTNPTASLYLYHVLWQARKLAISCQDQEYLLSRLKSLAFPLKVYLVNISQSTKIITLIFEPSTEFSYNQKEILFFYLKSHQYFVHLYIESDFQFLQE